MKINQDQNQFLLDTNITFLNHGSFGACPKPVFENYQEWQMKLEKQPVKFLTKDLYRGLKEARKSISNLIGLHFFTIICRLS